MFQNASKSVNPRSSGLIRDTIQKTKLVKMYNSKTMIHKREENGWKTMPSMLLLLLSMILTKTVNSELRKGGVKSTYLDLQKIKILKTLNVTLFCVTFKV